MPKTLRDARSSVRPRTLAPDLDAEDMAKRTVIEAPAPGPTTGIKRRLGVVVVDPLPVVRRAWPC